MNARSLWMGGALLAALAIGALAVPEAGAHGKGGGHSGGGGRAPRPPRVSAPRQNYQAPRTSRSVASSHANNTRSQAMVRNAQGHTRNAQAHTNNAQVRANNVQAHTNNTQSHSNNAQARSSNSQANLNNAQARANRSQANLTNAQVRASNNNAAVSARSSMLGTTSPTTTTGTNTLATGTRTNGTYFPNTYSYGSGAGTRALRAYGYGRGYRNNYHGSRSGYGRSQGSNRAIISRLRSVHTSLARIDRDYQGHRVRAMHAISMAVRQLSNRSMSYGNSGSGAGMNNGGAMGMNNGQAMGMRQGGLGGGGGRGGQQMTQAQSDNRMSQDLRALQGISMQLNNQGSNSTGHARARGHIQRAMNELNTALSVR